MQFAKHVSASDQGGHRGCGAAAFASRAHPRTPRGTAGGCSRASDQTGNRVQQPSPQERSIEQDVNVSVPLAKEEIEDSVQSALQERSQEHVVEQSAKVPVPRNKEEIAEVFQPSPQAHVQERIAKQSVTVSVPPAWEEVAEVVQSTHHMSASPRTCCGTECGYPNASGQGGNHGSCADLTAGTRSRTNRESDWRCSSASDNEDIAEVVPITPHERDQHVVLEQVMDFQVPLMKEEIAMAVFQPSPQGRIHERVVERIFDDLVPHFKNEVVEVLQGLFQEHLHELVVDQMVSFCFFFERFGPWLKEVLPVLQSPVHRREA